MKYVPLNFELIKSPLNWVTIILMIAIGMFAFDEILRLLNINGGDCGCNRSLFPIAKSE